MSLGVIMGLGKQSKTLNKSQIKMVSGALTPTIAASQNMKLTAFISKIIL